MAGNQRNDKMGKATGTDRRSFIRTVGATVTATAAGTASVGAASGAENASDPEEQAIPNDDLREDDQAGPASLPNRIEIEGTGDAEESVSYEFSVSGDLTVDESRTAVGSGEPLWLAGDITAGHVRGQVRDGLDGFFYSGTLERIEIDGKAAINAFQGDNGLES